MTEDTDNYYSTTASSSLQFLQGHQVPIVYFGTLSLHEHQHNFEANTNYYYY